MVVNRAVQRRRRGQSRVNGIALTALAILVGGCTSSGMPAPDGPTESVTHTVTRTHHVPRGKRFPPPPASTVAPYPANGNPPKGEVARSCPYVKAGLDSEPTNEPNI